MGAGVTLGEVAASLRHAFTNIAVFVDVAYASEAALQEKAQALLNRINLLTFSEVGALDELTQVQNARGERTSGVWAVASSSSI